MTRIRDGDAQTMLIERAALPADCAPSYVCCAEHEQQRAAHSLALHLLNSIREAR
jgi:hypothetical protein